MYSNTTTSDSRSYSPDLPLSQIHHYLAWLDADDQNVDYVPNVTEPLPCYAYIKGGTAAINYTITPNGIMHIMQPDNTLDQYRSSIHSFEAASENEDTRRVGDGSSEVIPPQGGDAGSRDQSVEGITADLKTLNLEEGGSAS